jgi:hypothetical protein
VTKILKMNPDLMGPSRDWVALKKTTICGLVIPELSEEGLATFRTIFILFLWLLFFLLEGGFLFL